MTWFLDQANAAPAAASPGIGGQIPGWWDQAVGSARDVWWRRDSWGAEYQYKGDLVREMLGALGGTRAVYGDDFDIATSVERSQTMPYDLAKRIGELREFDSEGRFDNLPGSAEEFDAELIRRRKKDFDENRAMLERGDSGSAKIAGEMVGTLLEPTSIATLPLGGSVKNAGRFIMTEAALGAASDLPGVIREQSVAKDLDFTPSNPLAELAVSAAASGAFAGVLVGGHRVLSYARTRTAAEAAERPAARSGLDYSQDIDTAEADLRTGVEPRPVMFDADPDMGGVIDDGYYAAIRSAESGGNDAAKNPLSSATGRYQFTQGTWNDLRRRKPELGLTADGRLDRNQQEIAIRAFTEENAASLRSADIPITRGNLYAAHFLGVGDARRVLRASNDLPLTQLLSPEVISANPFLRSMRVQDFRAWTIRKTGKGGGDVGEAGAGYVPSASAIPDARRMDWFDQVSTPAGTNIDVRYRVVDLGNLQRASGDLQPRNRTRAASDEQIATIARDLDPRRLMPSPESTSGAPIVGSDMIVESGNGRIAALNRAADEHPERYQAYIRAIEDAGFEIPEGTQRPALVAERLTDLDADARRSFVRESNTSSIGRMSATEQAGVDAAYLTKGAFDRYRAGQGLNSPDNADFVRSVFAAMPQAERAGLMTADGRLNIEGLRRLRQALFSRAFDADDLLKMLAETEHPAVENMLRMLEDLAPDWASFRAMVDAGYIREDFDITDQLMDVVRQIAKARTQPRDGQSVVGALRDGLNQTNMFSVRDEALAEALIDTFYKGDRARGTDATGAILSRYIAEAEAVGREDIDDMFAAEAPISPALVLREAMSQQDARAPMPRQSPEGSAQIADRQVDIRALDNVKTEDGAQSPALTRATDTELRELRDAPELGSFGPMFRDIENDPEAAITRLMAEKNGEVPVAFRHPDQRIGEVALVYGNEKYGLRHIEAKHPEMIPEIPRLLREGRVIEDDQGLPRIYLTDDAEPPAYTVLRLDWDGQDKTWVVTSFRDVDGGFRRVADERAKVISDTPTHSNDPFLGQEVGAAPNTRDLRTSGEPDASVPARIPDPTGQPQLSGSGADFQGDDVAQAIADARAAVSADPDISIRMGEGGDAPEIRFADLLDDLDQDQALIQRMTSCSLKGTPR